MPEDRLKPPPDTSRPNKIRLSSEGSEKNKTDLDKIVINNKRRSSKEDDSGKTKNDEKSSNDMTSSRKIILKRSAHSVSEVIQNIRCYNPIATSWLNVKKHLYHKTNRLHQLFCICSLVTSNLLH